MSNIKQLVCVIVFCGIFTGMVHAMEEISGPLLPNAVHQRKVEKVRSKKNNCFQGISNLLKKQTEDPHILTVQLVSLKIDETETLFHAVMNDKPKAVLQHILDGADVNQKNSIGWAPLHYAARDRNVAIAWLLLAVKGIDTASLNGQGDTPLQIILGRKNGAPKYYQRQCDEFIMCLAAHAKGTHPYKIIGNSLIKISVHNKITYWAQIL